VRILSCYFLELGPDLRKGLGESSGIPHLAKNERDVGHPDFSSGEERKRQSLDGLRPGFLIPCTLVRTWIMRDMGHKSVVNWAVVIILAWGPGSRCQTATGTNAKDLNDCRVQEVVSLPGSHQFASSFLEAIATDPDPKATDANVIWGLNADLSSRVPSSDRALFISKSSDGGKTWIAVARVDSKYLNAGIGEGERNGLGVAPGGNDFVITTQMGAFQVIPQSDPADARVVPIEGIVESHPDPTITITKKEGEPVKGGAVLITADGKHMVISYGYFDLDPHIFAYHRADDGTWLKDGPLPPLPTRMDILSMDFGDPKSRDRDALYVGTGDQAFRFDRRTQTWTRVGGVGADSAIHGMSTVGGLHLAACWGIYNPVGGVTVDRVTHARFLLHRDSDETGPNIRAYSIEVDPLRPKREVITAITGVYTSRDGGRTWKRLNGLPDQEFRSAHFNADGTVIVSGIAGTFLANPFSKACSFRLETRGD
jgi:hypothetical protein